MKKLLAMLLAVACVVCLFAGCVDNNTPSTPQTPTSSTNSKPTNPKPTEPKPTDTKPTGSEVSTLPGAPVGGDKVHIFLPSQNLAVGYTANGKKLDGVAGTVTDGVLTAEGAGVFEIIVDKDGYYTFICGGKYLTSGETGNALSLEYDSSEYSLWALEAADEEGNFYIYNVGAVFDGKNQYLEYYKGFTTYGFQNDKTPIYTFQFFKTDAEQPAFPSKPTMPADGSELTIEQILALPLNEGEISTERYYVTATVSTVSKKWYGEMYLNDSTGSVKVFNSLNADGTVKYENMTDKPLKGDTVKMLVNVENYNGTIELKNAWIVDFTHNVLDQSAFTEMSIEEARNTAVGTKIKVTGVVAQITYANSNVPSTNGKLPVGIILVDGTNSIYVYCNDVAQNVEIGNTVTICASKAMWILDTEKANADKFGYAGCNQLEDAYLVNNDIENTDFDKNWITETTMKDLMDTPCTTDITSKIFKVTAYVKKYIGDGFINYYFNDLDGTTGSYAYTQCNGADFAWLDAFDGKICTVYLMALNAKSTGTGCTWRLLPIIVLDEGFDISSVNIPEHVLDLFAVPQFKTNYFATFSGKLLPSVDNDLLQFTNAQISYTSADETILTFEEVEGKIVMRALSAGTTTVTITVTHNDVTSSRTMDITVDALPELEYGNVSSAVTAEPNTTVTIKGVVGPSLVNQSGFYLIDESGVIAVLVKDKAVLSTLELGQEIILIGTRFHKQKEDATVFGQTHIKDAEIIVNIGGEHPYSTESFAGELTVEEFLAFDKATDYTTNVYTMEVKVSFNDRTVTLTNADGSAYITLYASGVGQYKWLEQYNGQTITVEIAACDWNSKGYKGCVLAVILEDGTRVVNTLNFEN